jgi:fluoroacetyl-CoA thioesterase
MSLDPGLHARIERDVTEADTARSLGSGDVDVVGTPRVLAWCEAACVKALAGEVEPGETTVGMRIQLDHLQPTPVGGRVEIVATLERVEGRRLTFTVEASDRGSTIAKGRVVRVLVERDRFMERAAE